MSSWEQLAELPLQIEQYSLEPLEAQVSSEFTRKTTVIHLRGAGAEGAGEDVTYDALDHEILQAAGARRVWKNPVAESNFAVHLLGTCRMGDDPARSVIDRQHRTHDVRNLFLCDGSSFVTSGRGQPTMTIQALAFRAGDQIARLARAGEV